MSDRKGKKHQLDEFLRRELVGVNLDGVRMESVSPDAPPEAESTTLTAEELEALLRTPGFDAASRP